jgi:hypothetical protein
MSPKNSSSPANAGDPFFFIKNKFGRPHKAGDDRFSGREKSGINWVARIRGP